MSARRRKMTKPAVNPELQGFDIRINASGEIECTYSIDQLNDFLNRHVPDRKLTTQKTEKK